MFRNLSSRFTNLEKQDLPQYRLRKLISILFILCLCVACNKEYICKIDYKIDYPDTTLIKSYSFDCNSSGKYSVSENKDKLYIFYTEIYSLNMK